MTNVTSILSAIEQGDAQAFGQLLPLVYDELRKLAAAKMAQEAPGQTLQATALVYEVYLRLVGAERSQQWDSRGHFFAAATGRCGGRGTGQVRYFDRVFLLSYLYRKGAPGAWSAQYGSFLEHSADGICPLLLKHINPTPDMNVGGDEFLQFATAHDIEPSCFNVLADPPEAFDCYHKT